MKHSAIPMVLFTSACLAGCSATNPAPVFDASASRTLKVPEVLLTPGGQAKIRLPGRDVMLLVWRTDIGFGGTDLRCPHCNHELVFHPKSQTLVCPGGIQYRLDGSFLSGYVPEGETVQPLRAYVVELDGERLRILG